MRSIFIVSVLFVNLAQAQVIDTVFLHYGINKFELTRIQQQKINDKFPEINSSGSQIWIFGYTDFLGSTTYNKTLSVNRAKKVKEYILTKGIKENQIIICDGKGKQIPDKFPALINEGIPLDRKVEIVIKTNKSKEKEVIAQIEIGDVKEGETLVLENLNFLPGRHILQDKSLPELQKLLVTMERNPNLKIEIQGHICCYLGEGDGYDLGTGDNYLSKNRAKYIYDFLIQHGIDPNRLSYIGFGRRKPLVIEEVNEEARSKNRRVEIRILDK